MNDYRPRAKGGLTKERWEQLQKMGFRRVRDIRREKMLGPMGWLVTFGILIGSAAAYLVAVTVFCGLLLSTGSSPAQQADIVDFFRFMMYVGVVVVPLGNIIFWLMRWGSYEV